MPILMENRNATKLYNNSDYPVKERKKERLSCERKKGKKVAIENLDTEGCGQLPLDSFFFLSNIQDVNPSGKYWDASA